MLAEVPELVIAERRFREEIDAIVKRRAPVDMRLSWRLMFEIEDEAVTRLENEGLNMRYVNLMVSPSAQRPVLPEAFPSRAEVYPTRTALRMIQEAYQQTAH